MQNNTTFKKKCTAHTLQFQSVVFSHVQGDKCHREPKLSYLLTLLNLETPLQQSLLLRYLHDWRLIAIIQYSKDLVAQLRSAWMLTINLCAWTFQTNAGPTFDMTWKWLYCFFLSIKIAQSCLEIKMLSHWWFAFVLVVSIWVWLALAKKINKLQIPLYPKTVKMSSVTHLSEAC